MVQMEKNLVQEMLQSLKPKTKSLIIDVVEAVGIDVTDWRRSGADNPSYCYHWAFADRDHTRILFCLWYDDCIIGDDGVLHQSWNFRDYIKELEADGGPKAGRAREVDLLLQDAWRKKISVRVAIVDETAGRKANKKDSESSKADFRELDLEPWHIKRYDWMTGDCVIVRGVQPDIAEVIATDHARARATLNEQSVSGVDNVNADTYAEELAEDLLAQIVRTDLPETTRNALVQARVGQGAFRAALVCEWGGQCAATSCSELSVLRASHIKPWRSSDDSERLDPANGLLLTANLDALFDRGYITFSDSGRMLVTKKLGRQALIDFGLPIQLRRPLSERQRHYMKFHRDQQFQSA